jgi:predicted GH43/DUF377 family glycosyl hydrolase
MLACFGEFIERNRNVFRRQENIEYLRKKHSGIEFAAGLVEKGDDFIVSYGKDDLSSHIAIIPKDIVLNSLEEIPYR